MFFYPLLQFTLINDIDRNISGDEGRQGIEDKNKTLFFLRGRKKIKLVMEEKLKSIKSFTLFFVEGPT